MKIGMIVNPNVMCGIREHTLHFYNHLQTPKCLLSQNPEAKDHGDLLEKIKAEGVSIVHVQHEYSLFQDAIAFAVFIEMLGAARIRLVMDLHTGLTSKEATSHLNHWRHHASRIIVHTERMKERIPEAVLVPLAIPDDAMWASEVDTLVQDDAPIIGAVGFHVPHKGFVYLAQAMGLIRRDFPGTKLLIVGSHYNDRQHKSFHLTKEAAAQGPHVLLDRYVSATELVRTLAVCDLVVLPYRVDGLSQSGAVETALLSGRPVLLSRSTLLSHIPEDLCVGYVPTEATVRELGCAIRETLAVCISSQAVRRSRGRLVERRGSTLASVYDYIYEQIQG